MSEKFEAWGIVELMGHQRVAGRLSEQPLGGGNLLRVDIPDGEGFRSTFAQRVTPTWTGTSGARRTAGKCRRFSCTTAP